MSFSKQYQTYILLSVYMQAIVFCQFAKLRCDSDYYSTIFDISPKITL